MHILIVEDDADNARVLELALRVSRHGSFRCQRVQTLADALDRLASDRYDVVLLDLTVPDSRGLETLARVRARFRQVPVVVLTGMTDQAIAVRALQEGAQDYLIKGQVDGDAIARSVRYVIERTRAEREHEATRVQLELAAESVMLGIWEWDLRTGRIAWTQAMADIFGVAELEGPQGFFDRFLHPDDRGAGRSAAEQAIKRGEMYRRELRIVRNDGEVRWIETRGRGVSEGENVPAHKMIGTVLDITARKQAEAATRDRETAVAHLSRVSLGGQMAAGLAHELNQPLGAILNFAAVGLSQAEQPRPNLDAIQTSFRSVMDEARRAAQIIRGIREFLAKQEPRVTAVRLNEIVDGALSLMRYELERAAIRPRLDFSPDDLHVLADAVQVEQVLINLILNAIDAMQSLPATGRTLTITTEIDPAGTGRARVCVSDTGVGISESVAQRLFEPFYTTKTNGLGMGLNLSRTIVERLGGVIGMQPNAECGTCFSFTLPTTPKRAAHPSSSGQVAAYPAAALGATTTAAAAAVPS